MKWSKVAFALILAAVQVRALEEKLLGCWEDEEKVMKFNNTNIGQSRGICLKVCREMNLPLAGMLGGNECHCGKMMPADKAVETKLCDTKCAGFGGEFCGSRDGTYITIWSTGVGKLFPRPKPKTTTTSTEDSSKPTSSGSSPNESPSNPSEPTEEPKKSSGVSKAGAAAGAVVGVLAVAAIIGGGILFWKRRRQQQVEEEYRRTLAVQSFGKKPEADHRLEPVMLQRRASDGSIADNEDYSRRILKVTNPDG